LENGTPQGGVLSPTLFNLLMDELLKAKLPNTVEVVSYADDLLVIIKGKNPIRDGQIALNILTDKCSELGLKISKEKSRAMAFQNKLEREKLKIQDHELEWVQEYRYLGILVDNRLLFNSHVNYIRDRMKSRIQTMKVMTNTKLGANSKVLRTFYVQAVRSLVDYSSQALFMVSRTKLKRLETQQNNALRVIACAPRWSKTIVLQDLFKFEELGDRTQKLALGLIIKIYKHGGETTEWNNINKTLINNKVKGKWPNKVHKALVKWEISDQLKKDGVDKLDIGYSKKPPWYISGIIINVDIEEISKKETSPYYLRQKHLKNLENLNRDRIAYYTDSSVLEGGGAGAAIASYEQVDSWRLTDFASTLQTELFAIGKAAEHAKTHIHDVIIHTDSLTSIQAIQSQSITDNINILSWVLRRLYEIQDDDRSVIINWVPSHVGIAGNEEADRLAQEAAKKDHVDVSIDKSVSQYVKSMKKLQKKMYTAYLNLKKESSESVS